MMIKPKRIGDELTLDEYNACQYLLYQMKCWNETIILDTYLAYQGNYATYKLANNDALLNEKNETYRINKELTTTTTTCKINLTQIQNNILNLHINPTVTIYYRKPEILNNGDNEATEYDAEGVKEVNIWSKNESKETPQLSDYITQEVPTTLTNNTLTFQLVDDKGEKLPKETIIKKRIKINYDLNNEPYIDFRNGKANNMDEIIVDNQKELIQLIENAPTDGTLTVLRLDSNINPTIPKGAKHEEILGQYYITKTITIKKGQNIELRGGTNNNATINASIPKRCFIINPGGKLSLNHITCTYGYAGNTSYEKGKGGAILIENNKNEYGILECENCTFSNNTAWWGGAIYSYHAGLHINNTTFTNNTAGYSGGAIEYLAKNVNLYFKNIIAIPNTSIDLKCDVKDMNNKIINEGSITFYERINGTDTEIATGRVRQGTATVTYKVPNDTKTTEHTIVAKYTGGKAIDDDVTVATLTVRVPETYTASWVEGNVVKGKIGETITLNAKLVDSKGLLSTTPIGQYTINNNTVIAALNGNTYQLKYTLTEADIINDKKEFIASFTTVKSDEYTSNTITAKITIDTENSQNPTDGYITGLWINSNSISKYDSSIVTQWTNAGITDIYVRFTDYSVASQRTTLEKIIPLIKDKDIRLHTAINCFYDTANSKWITPTDTNRMTFLKNHIDYIANNYPRVNGIALDYIRYPGTKADDTAHTNITNKLKELNTYIKSKNKNYIIGASVMPEDDGSSLYYGQNFKEMSEYIDHLHIMAYKGNYADKNGNEKDDSWVADRARYAINKNISPEKVVICLQSYKADSDLTVRTKDNLTTTAKALKPLYIKGITLFREGLCPSGYVQSFKSIMEG